MQSSTTASIDATAGRAVDGNYNAHFSRGSCTHTDIDPSAWWAVDLGAVSDVNMVTLLNRGDCCGKPFSAMYTCSKIQIVSAHPIYLAWELAGLYNEGGI